MWPWDHLAVGYVAYSLLRRATGGSPPDRRALVAVLVGSQLPDLIDKPLGWYVGVLPSGVSLAHSLLFAVPVCVLVYGWRARRGAPDQGLAFAVGYLLHVPADAVYPAVLGSPTKLWIVLWPLTSGRHSSPSSVTDHVLDLLVQFGEVLVGPRGLAVVGIELALLATAVGLWVADGRPGSQVLGLGRRQDS